MIQRSFPPSPHLKKFIREYVLVHLEIDENIFVPVKPYPANPEQGITFYVKGFVTSFNPATRTTEKRPPVVIFGQPVSMQNLQPTHQYLMFDIRFQPGALFKLLRIPMTEFLHKNIDAELILGLEIRDVNDHLANTLNYDDMLSIVESYLWKKVKQQKDEYHPFEKIGPLIQESPQCFCLDKIASEACLSRSQFERKFQLQTGVTPKFFSRICRFYQAFELKALNPQLDWLAIAIQTGYNDYQHLVKDFKQFSGNAPNILIRYYAGSVERWLAAVLIPNFV
jgi:AraC-like DNA-binding protein